MRPSGAPRRARGARRRAPCAYRAAPLAGGRRASFRRWVAVDPDRAVAEDVAHFAVAAIEHFARLELHAAAALADRHADPRVTAARGRARVVGAFAVDPDGGAAAGALYVTVEPHR